MRGRKPVPTALKILRGNPGQRPLNLAEPKPPAAFDGFAMAPAELSKDPVALQEWKRLAPLLHRIRQVTEAERTVLIALCEQWSVYRTAHAKVADLGMIVKSPSGYPMTNPYLSVANKALQHCAKLWAELGLTPSARSRVRTDEDLGGAADDFAAFDKPLRPWAGKR